MSKETEAGCGSVAAPVQRPVRPVAAHMLTEDGSRHHLRFDVREVERTAKHMRQRCVMLYDQAALDTAVAAERERCERWAFLEDREGYLLSKIQSGERAPE